MIYTRIEQSSQMGENDERVRLFPLAIAFLPPFVELKYEKRVIPMKLLELTTCKASDVITRFKHTLEEEEYSAFVHIRNKIYFTQH